MRAGRIALRWGTARCDSRPRSDAATLRLRRSDVFSIEAAFILFLFSGRYKNFPELHWFPADFTTAFLMLTLGILASNLISRRLRPPPLGAAAIALFLFCEVAAASLLWSSMDSLNNDKLQRFLLLTAPGFFVALILSQDAPRRHRLVKLMAWLSLAIIGYYYYYRYVLGVELFSPQEIANGRLPEKADNYLEYSSQAQICFTVFLVRTILYPSTYMWSNTTGIAVSAYALATMGGRGPLAGALFAVPLSLLGLVLRQREPVLGLLRLVILIGVLSIPLTLMMTTEGGSDPDSQFRTLNRYELQISNEDTSSMDERGQARGLALELWLEKPLFGWGLGEFRIFDSYLNYPHNLPLEVLMEMGLLGGILFAVPMLAAGIACIRTLANPYGAFADTALALLCLVELMLHVTVQGYLADDRIFFAYLAFVLERSPPPSFARGAV